MGSKFKLYASDGISLIYTFPLIQSTNAPQSPLRHINIEGVRASGSLIIPAGTPSWNLELEGILMIDGSSENYDDLMAKIEELETTVALNTAYYLRMYKTVTILKVLELIRKNILLNFFVMRGKI